MNVERTIEFILEMQAKSEARAAKFEERAAKSEARMDKFDKRLEATRKLVETGMKILVKVDKSLLELGGRLNALTVRVDALAVQVDALTVQVDAVAVQVNALTEAQRKSDRKFDRLMDSWESSDPTAIRDEVSLASVELQANRGCYTLRSMDVERTMEFILEMQAKSEERIA